MSVSCSKNLIFAPECWKCILRGLDFINFPGGGGGVCPLTTLETGVSFFHLCLLQKFGHLLNKLIETQPAKTDFSPCSLPLLWTGQLVLFNESWMYICTILLSHYTGRQVPRSKCCNTVWYICNIRSVWLDSIKLIPLFMSRCMHRVFLQCYIVRHRPLA